MAYIAIFTFLNTEIKSDAVLSSVVMQRHIKLVAKYHTAGNWFILLKIL